MSISFDPFGSGKYTEISGIETLRPLIRWARTHGFGDGGGDGLSYYIHDQTTPSTSWAITHNLDRYPISCTVVSSGGDKLLVDIFLVNSNALVVSPSRAITGMAYIN